MSELTTRDYKGAGRAPRPPGGLSQFLWGALAGGLLAGLGAALLVHHADRSRTACAAPPARAPSHTAAAAASAAGGGVHSSVRSAAAAPTVSGSSEAALPCAPSARRSSAAPTRALKPCPAPAAQTHYDFYRMLPKLRVLVPPPTAPGTRGIGPRGHAQFSGYVLQVGAYTDEAQARRVVAYLDSLGILAHIDTAHDGTATLYRVRIGPIIQASELKRFRGVLKRVGLPGILIPGATY